MKVCGFLTLQDAVNLRWSFLERFGNAEDWSMPPNRSHRIGARIDERDRWHAGCAVPAQASQDFPDPLPLPTIESSD